MTTFFFNLVYPKYYHVNVHQGNIINEIFYFSSYGIFETRYVFYAYSRGQLEPHVTGGLCTGEATGSGSVSYSLKVTEQGLDPTSTAALGPAPVAEGRPDVRTSHATFHRRPVRHSVHAGTQEPASVMHLHFLSPSGSAPSSFPSSKLLFANVTSSGSCDPSLRLPLLAATS